VALFFTLGLAGESRAAGLLVADGGSGGALEIREHDVHVTINNGISVTQVTQVFGNTEARVVEALYTFPVPRGASVANFSMWINGKEMTGEVLEKKRARAVYESYKQTRRDPGLLEQVDYRTFEMRIFPIAAGAEQRVQVTYYQELDFDHDWATYVYPLATQTRPGIDSRTTGRFALTMDVRSEIPIVEMDSPSHAAAFVFARHDQTYQQASLEARGGELSRDVVLAYHVSRPRTGIDVITSRAGREDGYFAVTLTAGEELAQFDTAMDYVFVLDISGSMNADGKLDTSRRAVAAFIDALGTQDRFEVVPFNIQPEPLFGQLQSAEPARKDEARAFLDSRVARGGTVLNPAMSTAYRYADGERPLNVVILSDGMTEQSERAQLVQLIGRRPPNTRVFCIGVGNDVNRPLLEQLANDSGGLAAFVSREDSFDRQAQAFRRKLLRPIATDLAITIDGVETYDLEPRQLPNLYHGAPVRLYGRYKGDGPATVVVTAAINGRALKQSAPIELPKQDEANPQIERMWAWHRVDRLLKGADAAGSRSSVIDEIVRLGEGYSIVTEYTSFIVLENDQEYRRWKIDRANALRVERDRAAQQAVARDLEKLRASATAALGPVEAEKAGAHQVALNVTAAPVPTGGATRDLNFDIGGGGAGGRSGGGAIDPVTGVLIITFAGMLSRSAMRRRSSRDA
jgi:Ca-activated chloride channel family protein